MDNSEIEALGKVVAKVVDKVMEKVIMPWDLETVKYLVGKDVTLGDIYKVLMEDIETGKAREWTQESKDAWTTIYQALKFGRGLVQKLPLEQTVPYLQYDKVMEYLGEKKPDYYEYFKSDPMAQVWFKRNLKEIRIMLYGRDPIV